MVRYSRCPVMFLIYVLAAIFSALIASVSANFAEMFSIRNVSFQPPFLSALKEGKTENVSVYVTVETSAKNFTLKYESEDPSVAWTESVCDEDSSFVQIPETSDDYPNKKDNPKILYFNTTFTVRGLFLGKTKISIHLTSTDKNASVKTTSKPMKYDVWVIRDNKKMQHIFVGTLSILLIIANVLMGAQLNLSIVLEVLKKPLAPFIGFFCQYLFMPLVITCNCSAETRSEPGQTQRCIRGVWTSSPLNTSPKLSPHKFLNFHV